MKPRTFRTWAIVPVRGKLNYGSFQGIFRSKGEAEKTLKYNVTMVDDYEVVEVEITELRGGE